MIKIKLDPDKPGHMKALALLAGALSEQNTELKVSVARGAEETPAPDAAEAPEKPAVDFHKALEKKKASAKKEAPTEAAEEKQTENETKPKGATLDDIREMIGAKKDKHIDEIRTELLDRYKVPNINKLAADLYDEFYLFLSKL
jgi:hypothetical protein